ncbi:THO complex subunit 2 [Iris pallida]|uniref:THO complex subunit 2 n=1 Tax=Iris pallida TaxID=29817 RepID=A0AAX6FL17_IRIPA|nr:THO complex subunit 2 [Iris pallida]
MSLQTPEFKYVTEERLQEWKSSGSGSKLSDPVPMDRYLYELCWSMVRGSLPFPKCQAALDSVVFSGGNDRDDIGSVFADVIAHMGQDLTMPGDYRVRLTKMAKWLVEFSLVPSRLLQERCEEEFLWETDMAKIKAQDLKAKEVRVNTRLLYQQTKFNLLREESEGYAKLVTLLCQGGLDAMTESTSMATISTIKSLIGHFDLDPNRVFDIVLECFELYPDTNIFYNLIPIFPKSHAGQILGFKFQYYQGMEVKVPVPSGLYRLAALLVKAEFIDLDTIYAHLLPKDDAAYETYDAFVAKRIDEANKIGKINLAATGKDLMEDEKQDVTVDLFTALDMESNAVIERAPEIENNQSLGLLIGFLSVDDWYHAQILFDRLSHLNPVEHLKICEALFRLIEKTISPTYSVVCQPHLPSIGGSSASSSGVTGSLVELSKFCTVDLPRVLFEMLAVAGPYLHRDAVLLQKVCRVLRAYLLSSHTCADKSSDLRVRDPRFRVKEAKLRVQEALGTCLLPSLQLIPANPAVGQEIWEVLSQLPYEVRYRLYGEWERDDEQIPMVLAAKKLAKLDTRRILKRLAKENLKQLGRMVAKLAHANPMTVLRTIVHQIEAYKDMITPVVDAFKYLNQLEYDVLEYVVIERLAQGGREKLKDDGLNLSDWLQSLASFWGHLCKKYPSMELRGLFQYLANQLKKGVGIELVLLQELIQQMANVQYTENMTDDQLGAMAGSDTLRYQATLFGMTRNNKALIRSMNRLRDSLLPKEEPKLAIPLLLLIAQHRSMVVIKADAPYIKMVSEQYDRCHGTLLQYVEFLSSAISPSTKYAQLIPSLDDLVHKYHLDPEVAFLVYRPVMRLFKCAGSADIFWPLDNVEQENPPSAENDSDLSSSSSDVILDLGSLQKAIKWSDLLDTVRSTLPPKAWNGLSSDLYVTFWGLTLYDLYVPKNQYESEISKQHAAIKALEELSDNSNTAITKRKKDKERIQELIDRLISELKKHEEHVVSVSQRLSREKDEWLSSCPDTSKINMEFLQRCILPRCVFSMADAVYSAFFVHTLHSLGTPFFNTVNHIDVLICRTLHPMICCCTEFEAGRLGRFLYETLKMAYHWKSDESIYERECGNMPGFAVYYRFPDSQRVTFIQYLRVFWKWSGRMTRLLVQCLESPEYMEIRNALIVLTKISSVFPITRKSGINLEKRVAKIKGDEREDLKVLATGVAAALAARKNSWVSEEEFGMGYVDFKLASAAGKILSGSSGSAPNCSAPKASHNEITRSKSSTAARNQVTDTTNSTKDHIVRGKSSEGRADRSECPMVPKVDSAQHKLRGNSANGHDTQPVNVPPPSFSFVKSMDEVKKVSTEESQMKVVSKGALDSETKSLIKRSVQNSLGKQSKQEMAKEEAKVGKSLSRMTSTPSTGADKDLSAHEVDVVTISTTTGNLASDSGKVSTLSSRMAHDTVLVRTSDDIADHEVSRTISTRPSHSSLPDDSFSKQQKRAAPAEEDDKLTKRRKGDIVGKDIEGLDTRPVVKAHDLEHDKTEHEANRSTDKHLDKSKDKAVESYDKDRKEKLDYLDKNHAGVIIEKARDRSMERRGRERSVEKIPDRGADKMLDRSVDKARDVRSKFRHNEGSDDRLHGRNLPPPPPLPPSYVPLTVGASRRDEEAERRVGGSRHIQRLSPRHDEKRRSEENVSTSQDDAKRRREDDLRERKRDDRDGGPTKVDERDRDKGSILKDDIDSIAVSKRRKLKRDHTSSYEAGEMLPQPPVSLPVGMLPTFDARERGDRKGIVLQHRAGYIDEQGPRLHGKEAASKINRREADQTYEREWEEDKRQRTDAKRKHRK